MTTEENDVDRAARSESPGSTVRDEHRLLADQRKGAAEKEKEFLGVAEKKLSSHNLGLAASEDN